MLRRYASEVSRTTAVVLGVLAVLVVLLLIAVGISVLVHNGGKGRSPVVTVPTSR